MARHLETLGEVSYNRFLLKFNGGGLRVHGVPRRPGDHQGDQRRGQGADAVCEVHRALSGVVQSASAERRDGLCPPRSSQFGPRLSAAGDPASSLPVLGGPIPSPDRSRRPRARMHRVELIEGCWYEDDSTPAARSILVPESIGALARLLAGRMGRCAMQCGITLHEASRNRMSPSPVVRKSAIRGRHPGPRDIVLLIEVAETSLHEDRTHQGSDLRGCAYPGLLDRQRRGWPDRSLHRSRGAAESPPIGIAATTAG